MTFDWLPMSDRKGISSPRIILRDFPEACGYFYPRTADRSVDDWLDLDRREGDVIVLSTHWGEPAASVVAHEHRHLQQRYSLALPQILNPEGPAEFDDHASWAIAIRRFYLSQPWEADALRYSMRVARDELAEQQWEACS